MISFVDYSLQIFFRGLSTITSVSNLDYYLGFSYFNGIGPMRLKALIAKFGNAKKAYRSNRSDLQNILSAQLIDEFLLFRSKFDPLKELEVLKQKRIQVISCEDKEYPSQLKDISDGPICLYIKGDLNSIDFNSNYFIGIVGTRRPTSYGIQITKKFASELSRAGFIVVSGMATGIDAVGHRSALESGGKTIAILGCGVDIPYPPSNIKLYEDIIKNSGLIISEFPPGHRVEKGLFIARNRIISGLSKGVLIIEGLKDSGALITARFAAEQGKEVFASPGPITSPLSQAPHMLLKQGAKLVTSVEDIYEELGLQLIPKKKEDIEMQLNNQEKEIFQALQKESLLIDEIAVQIRQPIHQVLDIISLLEIKGVIEKNSEGKYQVKL